MAFSSFCMYKIVEKKWKYYYQWQDLLCDTYLPLLFLLPPLRIVNKHVKIAKITENFSHAWHCFYKLQHGLNSSVTKIIVTFFLCLFSRTTVYICVHMHAQYSMHACCWKIFVGYSMQSLRENGNWNCIATAISERNGSLCLRPISRKWKAALQSKLQSKWKPIMHCTGLHFRITSTELFRFSWCF